MQTIQRYVSASLFAIFAIVVAVIAIEHTTRNFFMPALGSGAVSAGCAVAAAFIMSSYEKRAKHAAAALFTAMMFASALTLREYFVPTSGWLGTATFGILFWLLGIFAIYNKFFAKEPRPSRYYET